MGAIGTTIVTIRFVGLALIIATVVTGRTEVLWTILLHPGISGRRVTGCALSLLSLVPGSGAHRSPTPANASSPLQTLSTSRRAKPGTTTIFRETSGGSKPISRSPDAEIAEQANVNALAFGLGFRVGTSWKSVLWGIGISAVGVLVWHFIHGRKAEVLNYLVFTAFLRARSGRAHHLDGDGVEPDTRRAESAATDWRVAIGRSHQASFPAWRTHESDGQLGGLGRRQRDRIRRRHGIVRSDIDRRRSAMLAAASATVASFGFLLARRVLKKENASTIATVLSVVIGALVCASGVLWNSVGNAATGLALIALPPLLAFCVFWLKAAELPVKKA